MSKNSHIRLATAEDAEKHGFEPRHGGPGGGGGGGMEGYAREADLRELKAKVDATLPHLATKADLSSLESSLIKWFVGTSFAAVGISSAIAFGIARFLL